MSKHRRVLLSGCKHTQRQTSCKKCGHRTPEPRLENRRKCPYCKKEMARQCVYEHKKWHCPKNPRRSKRTFKKKNVQTVANIFTRNPLPAIDDHIRREANAAVQNELAGVCCSNWFRLGIVCQEADRKLKEECQEAQRKRIYLCTCRQHVSQMYLITRRCMAMVLSTNFDGSGEVERVPTNICYIQAYKSGALSLPY